MNAPPHLPSRECHYANELVMKLNVTDSIECYWRGGGEEEEREEEGELPLATVDSLPSTTKTR